MATAVTSPEPYRLKISRLTIDKLGVKLYDKASAVVAELVANSYDADAENVIVKVPLNSQLATRVGGVVTDRGFVIEVVDDGHGMNPDEARDFYLRVGADRRANRTDGGRSRGKARPVMGRKGIGKLAPFGICNVIEVRSAGGEKTANGYEVTHFFMDFATLVTDDDEPVVLRRGSDDRSFDQASGTTVRLSDFHAKRVPDSETFLRQMAVRFTFANPDFDVLIEDTSQDPAVSHMVEPLNVPLLPGTKVDLGGSPVDGPEGIQLPVSGWLGLALNAYENEEMTGVRIYARGKIVAVTRDFNQPSGFTGEYTLRSYLVGEVHADWLDLDDGDDLIRTDRQDILWDSDYGTALRTWGAGVIKDLAKSAREPRRKRVRSTFLAASNIAQRAKDRYGPGPVADVAVKFAESIGGFAAEDELTDAEYVEDLAEVVLTVAPYQALLEALRAFTEKVLGQPVTLDDLEQVFTTAGIAELAAYAQVSSQRLKVIDQLSKLIDETPDESEFQKLISQAPWLIQPSWTLLTQNQSLGTFSHEFEKYWKAKYNEEIVVAVDQKSKRPDFTMVSFEGVLHFVEIKKAGHKLDNDDVERLFNYVEALDSLFSSNKQLSAGFYRGWKITLVVDGVGVTQNALASAVKSKEIDGSLLIISWADFLDRARKAHEELLEIRDASLASGDGGTG